ncbi:MAG: hypothetical protein K2Q25_13470 [Mycobacteriaceae bacterium]|nr:hypothetical protein [Mycobacteriaceae bacterium]
MATFFALGECLLVYLVYNTISNLLTQAERVACSRNAARHLAAGDRFVLYGSAESNPGGDFGTRQHRRSAFIPGED